MQEQRKHEQLGDFGGIPGAPSGPPADKGAAENSPQPRYEIHEVALLFPVMSDAEYAALRESIRAIGLTDPIWTWQGKIIDGRHRLRVCIELGIEPKFREWDGKG